MLFGYGPAMLLKNGKNLTSPEYMRQISLQHTLVEKILVPDALNPDTERDAFCFLPPYDNRLLYRRNIPPSLRAQVTSAAFAQSGSSPAQAQLYLT